MMDSLPQTSARFLLIILALILPNLESVASRKHLILYDTHRSAAVEEQESGFEFDKEKTRSLLQRRTRKPEPLMVAGSSLPDCSHACGSCSPCHLVMVSFVCASLEEAETCPMAYKCMCNSKSYPVP